LLDLHVGILDDQLILLTESACSYS
jgi:hypothetical protein